MEKKQLPGSFDGPSEHVGTQEGYDMWSSVYDAEDNPLVALEEPRTRALLGHVSSLDVLDMGCGTGRHTAWLASRGARVTAVDFSEGMVEQARRKPEWAGVRFVAHDLNKMPLPFAEASFDRLVCALVLEHLVDVGAFFRETRRLVRPGGFAIVSAMHPAMWLAGVQARFTDPASGKKILVGSHRQTVSEYVMSALRAGWRIEEMGEFAVDEALAARMPKARKYLDWDMLVMMKVS